MGSSDETTAEGISVGQPGGRVCPQPGCACGGPGHDAPATPPAPAASAVTRAEYDAVLAVLAECRDLISRRMVAKGVNREQQAAQRAEARIILQRIDAALRGTTGGAS